MMTTPSSLAATSPTVRVRSAVFVSITGHCEGNGISKEHILKYPAIAHRFGSYAWKRLGAPRDVMVVVAYGTVIAAYEIEGYVRRADGRSVIIASEKQLALTPDSVAGHRQHTAVQFGEVEVIASA